MSHPIATTANGKAVYVDLTRGSAGPQVSRNPHLLVLAREALAGLQANDDLLTVEHDAGRPIGYCDSVETDAADVVFYARQLRQEQYTRFVKNKKCNPTSVVTLLLQRDDSGGYELTRITLGAHTPPLDTAESPSDYWATHAVVYNGQPIITNSITKSLPQ